MLSPVGADKPLALICHYFSFCWEGTESNQVKIKHQKNAIKWPVGLTQAAAGEVKVTLTVPESETALKKKVYWSDASLFFFNSRVFPSDLVRLCHYAMTRQRTRMSCWSWTTLSGKNRIFVFESLLLFSSKSADLSSTPFLLLAESLKQQAVFKPESWHYCAVTNLAATISRVYNLTQNQRGINTASSCRMHLQSKTILLLETWAVIIKW